ncbi:MAG: DCC1-like thiol-disulfide oxidoreductase family protein [Candidatus Pacebacteria bacterium]|nr:DCC1-like thiol-disulfide oxidoreductase family protein [Candidatus Paceibacterota bacterium]
MIKEFQGKYRWLSNFWPVQMEYKGRVFHNVENAFHSEKSDDKAFKNFCASESNPRIVKKKQREMIKLRSDWEEVKEDIMLELTRIKYQNPELQRKLFETGNQYLQEGNYWNDIFWGVNIKTGKGENRFGKILMKVREEIQQSHILHKYLKQKKKIVLFDGECNLCDWSVQLLLKNDPNDTFRFASLQSDIGQKIQDQYGIDNSTMKSVILIDDYTKYKSKTSAIFSMTRSMGKLWPLFNIFWIVPKFIRDAVYTWVSKNRYSWFGKMNTCMVMTDEIRHKFLDYHE